MHKLLLVFDWLQAKLEVTDISSLVSDYNHLPENQVLTQVQGALRLSAHVLARDKKQLPCQLLGRLQMFKETEIQSMLEQTCGYNNSTWLRPLTASLIPPGGPLIYTMEGHNDGVLAVAVTPDGRRAISASSDRTLKVWDLETGENMSTMEGHNDSVSAVAVTPDGLHVISASADKTIKVWDLETGENMHMRTMEDYIHCVNAMAVTPGGRCAILASHDKTIKVWDLETGKIITEFSGDGPISSCAVSSDEVIIVAGKSSGRVHFLRLEEKDPHPGNQV